jgi:hypothetical protein
MDTTACKLISQIEQELCNLRVQTVRDLEYKVSEPILTYSKTDVTHRKNVGDSRIVLLLVAFRSAPTTAELQLKQSVIRYTYFRAVK